MSQQTKDAKGEAAGSDEGKRLVYVVADSRADEEDSLDLLALWEIVKASKWLIVSITFAFLAAATIYAFTAKHWYTAEVLLLPTAQDPLQGALSGQLGGLAGLAGLAGLGLGGNANPTEPLAVLTSHGFLRRFIEEHGLLTVLLADKWNDKAGQWNATDPRHQPDVRDAIRFFDRKILAVKEDKRTRLITVSVRWTDPEIAATWANMLVANLNDRMRQRSLVEAEANLKYLKRELDTAGVVTLQQSIGRLLEAELQKEMLAKGKQEFALRIVDPASPPKWRSSPRRAQLLAIALVLGVALSMFVAFALYATRESVAKARRSAAVST